jgi:DNA-binding CsgD family transcriptional regulator
VPVGVLGLASAKRHDSVRYRELLAPSGFLHELRFLAASPNDHAWLGMSFMRSGERGPFRADEVKSARVLGSVLGAELGSFLPQAGEPPPAQNRDPAMLIIDGADVETANPSAGAWLAELGPWPEVLPGAVVAAVQQARGGKAPATLRVLTHDGVWAGVAAWPLDDGRVGVALGPASMEDTARLLLAAAGLSQREFQVAEFALAGYQTAAIARRLHLSTFTVADHLKAVFAKTGAGNRRELVTALFLRRWPAALPRGRSERGGST